MELNSKINCVDDMNSIILDKFIKLPLEAKLVIYAKFVHNGSYRSENNDIFNLNRKLTSKIYKNFIEDLRKELC